MHNHTILQIKRMWWRRVSPPHQTFLNEASRPNQLYISFVGNLLESTNPFEFLESIFSCLIFGKW